MSRKFGLESLSESALAAILPGAEFLPKTSTEEPTQENADEVQETVNEEEPQGEEDVKHDSEISEREVTVEDNSWPESAQHRVNKLSAQRHEAERKAEAAETKLAELQKELESLRANNKEEAAPRASQSAVPQEPLSHVQTEEELQTSIADAQRWQEWSIRNPDGGEITLPDGQSVVISPEQAKDLQVRSTQILTIHAPRRAAYLQQIGQHTSVAKEVYPEMFQPGSEDHKAVQSLLQHWPEITRFPDYLTVLGDYLRGNKARLSAGKANEKTEAVAKAPVKKTPPLAPPVPRTTAMIPGKPNNKQKAVQVAAASGGSLDSIARAFAASRR